MSDSFNRILGQPQVRRFLRAVISSGRVGQTYLFTGPVGSNKTQAAYAFAQAILCEEGGCGTCDTCKRVMRHRHPDVRFYEPESASGDYLVGQIREIVSDVTLAPIQAKGKVYIINRADRLSVQAANAFLKTLEEPPEDCTIILMGRTVDGVLPTIVSRCQVVPFRFIPAAEAAGIVVQNSGCSEQHALAAIQACNGSITGAIEFVKSSDRFAFRGRVIDILQALPLADDLDVLEYAAELLEKTKAPLDLVRSKLEEELAASADFMAASALRQIEARNKRALSSKSRSMLFQTTSIIRSWLRDVLMVRSGAGQLVINEDYRGGIEEAAARADTAAISRALVAVDEADKAIRYNVSPETCIDVLLLQIREELYGSHCARGVAI
ncbi:DNA polymerase III subunit delta [Denitrobacterium detoxificans]|mgnify:CR=1 FL=1|uniref:DNA polymerase III, delta prime subunit n=1 Tax=Denitrobacterium detoxificans TaxID=79604 RepID=A0A172RYQ2_9ACTN|nr:DNA polymerase III subunit delta' [Denitrobacterium detoxificans]ANE22861.1 DNA polymerase III subunit delta [Denitrobacterium detoxificans]SEO69795.1 DNA polymerase III, delta prime subunit [Denitrobacterium detoxificans]